MRLHLFCAADMLVCNRHTQVDVEDALLIPDTAAKDTTCGTEHPEGAYVKWYCQLHRQVHGGQSRSWAVTNNFVGCCQLQPAVVMADGRQRLHCGSIAHVICTDHPCQASGPGHDLRF